MVYFPQERMTDAQKYHSGLMSDAERRAYETHLASQQFVTQEEEETRAAEMAQADIDWAAQQEISPEQAAAEQYKARTGRYPTNYIPQAAPPSPNWVEETPGFQIPMDPSVGAPMAPPTGAPPTDAPPEEPAGRDYGAEIRGVQERFGGPKGLLRGAEGAWETRRGEIAEQYRTGEEARVTQAQEELNKAKGVLGIATEKLSNWDINPQRAFPNAFSKIAAVISVAMGAYAQGLSGGDLPNTALGIINNAIKTDIDAQKMEYQQLKGLVDEKRNVYGMAMRLLGNAEQAEQVAYTAAYQTYQAEINKIGKEYGLEYGAIDLSSKIDQGNRQIEVNAAKVARGRVGKLPTEMKRAISAFSAIAPKVSRLWNMSKEMNVVMSAIDIFIPGERPSKTFQRESEKAASDLVYAISGVTARKEEYDRALKWAPGRFDIEDMRIAKMIGLMEYAVDKGVEHYASSSPQLRATLPPHLRVLYEMTPDQRKGMIFSMLEGQGFNLENPEGGDWAGKLPAIRAGIKKSTFGDLGGERVTGKK